MEDIKEMGKEMDEIEELEAYALWLALVEGLGNRAKRELADYAGTPRAVYRMGESELRRCLPVGKVKKVLEAQKREEVRSAYREFRRGGMRFLPIHSPEYPQKLREIEDAPYGLFLFGGMPEAEKPSVAVIGARQCSEYGGYMAEKCGTELAKAGVNVISGMARGVDGISQKAALAAGGKSYGILGCGADICYPSENRSIYEWMKRQGGILSEYPAGTQPKAQLFPPRNRIISGLADVVLIIEARVKSGTLITADMALEQGREVYVLPGRATDALSEGCNRLLKQGAGVFTTVPEMLEETGLAARCGKNAESLGEAGHFPERKESLLERAVDFYPKGVEQLKQETGMDYREMICGLMRLCADGRIRQISAGQYVRLAKGDGN